MSRLDQLIPASFRGVDFLVPSDSITEGRKTVTHEYVNSNRRFVEDLGALPEKFTLTIIISETQDGNILERRDNLRRALKTPGLGILIHPVYGRQSVTVEGSYEITREDTNLGIFTFRVTFARSQATIQPSQVQTQVATVFNADTNLRDASFNRLGEQWQVPRTSEGIVDATDKLNDFSSIMEKALNKVAGDKEAFSVAINTITQNANELIFDGLSLSNAVKDIYLGLDDAAGDPFEIYRALTELFDFGVLDKDIINRFGLSLSQFRRDINRDLLNSTIRTASVSQAYTNASNSDFVTVAELSEARDSLDVAVRDIIADLQSQSITFSAASNQGIRISPAPTADIVLRLQSVRSAANKVFEQKELNTFKITELRNHLTSSRLVSYSLYESEDNAETIGGINLTQRPSNLRGNIDVLTK